MRRYGSDGLALALGREPTLASVPSRSALASPAATADFDYEAALARCANGDRSALHAIYTREARWLMGVALRIVRRRELADEVLHDAFLQIWQKAASFNPHLGSGRGWIFTIVRHRAFNVLRDAGHEEPAAEDYDETAHTAQSDPTDSLSETIETGALHGCLQRLDEAKRNCILLAYVDGYTHQQIAVRLEAPLGSVKAWIRRGLLMLKACLS
jgi:RNA polymerase sigma-70 factor (ECF subfamily)